MGENSKFYRKINFVLFIALCRQGVFILKKMRFGFTTGSCAAAGTKAALLACLGEKVSLVEIFSPQGEKILIPIQSVELTFGGAKTTVIKDAGDDPDITNGTAIIVEVKIKPERSDVILRAGKGVGWVTKPGLSVPIGAPAINLGPRTMIQRAVDDVLGAHKGCEIIISIPDGEALAKRTLNPTLGIEGGLSIIGTTGIVRPMSEEAFKTSLSPQIHVAKALGYDAIVFVPGKIGEEIAIHQYGLPKDAVIQTSNFVGHMLEAAVEAGVKQVLLFGHLGKLVKVASGIFHTHNRVADARLETIAAYLAACGATAIMVQEILDCTTTEGAMSVIERYQMSSVYPVLAKRASIRAGRYVFSDLQIGTVLITLKGEILGLDDMARAIGGRLGWNIK